jgi:hypothetical protein
MDSKATSGVNNPDRVPLQFRTAYLRERNLG